MDKSTIPKNSFSFRIWVYGTSASQTLKYRRIIWQECSYWTHSKVSRWLKKFRPSVFVLKMNNVDDLRQRMDEDELKAVVETDASWTVCKLATRFEVITINQTGKSKKLDGRIPLTQKQQKRAVMKLGCLCWPEIRLKPSATYCNMYSCWQQHVFDRMAQ